MSESIIEIETNISQIYKNNTSNNITLNINWTSFSTSLSGYLALIIYQEAEDPSEDPTIIETIYTTCNNSNYNLNYRYILEPNQIFGIEKDLNSNCSILYYTIENLSQRKRAYIEID